MQLNTQGSKDYSWHLQPWTRRKRGTRFDLQQQAVCAARARRFGMNKRIKSWVSGERVSDKTFQPPSLVQELAAAQK